MAITFAARGDQLNARYAPEGATAETVGSGTHAVVNSNQAGINGSTSIDMSGASATERPLLYLGGDNLPAGRAFSILMRLYFDDVATSQGLLTLGFGGRIEQFGIFLYFHSTNQIRFECNDESGNNFLNTGTTSFATISTWHDVVITFTGDTTANGNKIYLDGVLDDQATSTVTMPADMSAYRASTGPIKMGYGGNDTYDLSRYHLDELVIWDSVIDPTSVTLTSGLGSLNGASRTAYVDVAAQDGPLPSSSGRVIKSL